MSAPELEDVVAQIRLEGCRGPLCASKHLGLRWEIKESAGLSTIETAALLPAWTADCDGAIVFGRVLNDEQANLAGKVIEARAVCADCGTLLHNVVVSTGHWKTCRRRELYAYVDEIQVFLLRVACAKQGLGDFCGVLL